MQPSWLAPSFAAALEAGPEALRLHAEQVAPGEANPDPNPSPDPNPNSNPNPNPNPHPSPQPHTEQVAPGVFAFDMLSEAFCSQLLAELARHEEAGLPVVRSHPDPDPDSSPDPDSDPDPDPDH